MRPTTTSCCFVLSLLWLLGFSGHFAYAQAKAPLIGLSCSYETSSSSVPNTYIISIQRAGGIPVLLPVTADTAVIRGMVDRIDALILTGGEDIGPLAWYGQEPNPNLGTVVPQRDFFDITLLRMAVARGIPVMGICRGEQAMNVAFGGTLYQDLPSQYKEGPLVQHNQKSPRENGAHSITVEPGSLLYRTLGAEAVQGLRVNSFHHQAVRDLAPGFEITAHAKDGVVEAIEMKNNPRVFGVQFHPEGPTSMGDETFLPLFRHLVQEAQKPLVIPPVSTPLTTGRY